MILLHLICVEMFYILSAPYDNFRFVPKEVDEFNKNEMMSFFP